MPSERSDVGMLTLRESMPHPISIVNDQLLSISDCVVRIAD